MRPADIMRLINRYIGVSGGYLGNFSYRTHQEFYPEYCDLDIDPGEYPGTTRERFIAVLKNTSPSEQAKIIRGVIQRFPVEDGGPSTRTPQLREELLLLATQLESSEGVAAPGLGTTSDVVERALADAETLLKTSGATSAIDRVHTALQGYLRTVCADAGIDVEEEATVATLFKMLYKDHSAFKEEGPRHDDVLRMLRSAGGMLDALAPLRNKASVAHPNAELLRSEEAALVVNLVKTLLHYVNAKCGRQA